MIQNADINVGPGHYRNLKADELLVTSIFYTIQGEGPFAGHPAIFIRLAGCNRGRKEGMGCEFCDTKFHFDQGQVLSFAEIEEAMQAAFYIKTGQGLSAYSANPIVVITGGEPMMQENLWGLCYALFMKYPRIQIESNGDRLIKAFAQGLPSMLSLVVSPKVVDGKYRMLRKEVFDTASALKFVVDADPASPYHEPPKYASEFKGGPVYLSPLAVYREGVQPGEVASAWDHALIDAERTKANYAHAAALAMRTGFRLSLQTHLFAAVP